jgi:hypothetical protein
MGLGLWDAGRSVSVLGQKAQARETHGRGLHAMSWSAMTEWQDLYIMSVTPVFGFYTAPKIGSTFT